MIDPKYYNRAIAIVAFLVIVVPFVVWIAKISCIIKPF